MPLVALPKRTFTTHKLKLNEVELEVWIFSDILHVACFAFTEFWKVVDFACVVDVCLHFLSVHPPLSFEGYQLLEEEAFSRASLGQNSEAACLPSE